MARVATIPSQKSGARRWRYVPGPAAQWLALAAILALATFLRLFHLDAKSLWCDEMGSLAQVTGHLDQLRSLPVGQWMYPAPSVAGPAIAGPWWHVSAHGDLHPPLSTMLERLFVAVLGSGDAVLRGSSVLASVVSILLFYLICREFHPISIALEASLIMALAQSQIYFAQEARGYALVVALALGACLAMLRLQKSGGGTAPAVALAACALAAMLTHYLAAGVLAALASYALLRMNGPARRQAIVALGSAAIIFAILWGPMLLRQKTASSADTSWLHEPADRHLCQTLHRLVLLPAYHLAIPVADDTRKTLIAAAVYLLPLLLLRRRRDLFLWSLWLAGTMGPLLLVDLVAGTKLLSYTRYSMLASPAILAIVAAAASDWRILRWLLPTAAVLACAVNLPEVYDPTSRLFGKAPYREIGQWLAVNSQPGDMTVFSHTKSRIGSTDEPWELRFFYAMVSHYVDEGWAMPGPVLLLDGKPHDVLGCLHGRTRVWVITNDDIFSPQEIIPGAVIADLHNCLYCNAGRIWLVSVQP